MEKQVCMLVLSTILGWSQGQSNSYEAGPEMDHGRPGSQGGAWSDGFYNYAVTDQQGRKINLSRYHGKVSLVVNVASECGFTERHYKGLARLIDMFASTQKFEVLAFPCNQFGGQEPKPDQEISQEMKSKYGANFPIFAKVNVVDKNVPDAWKYLIEKSGQAPNWNFFKYLVNPEGKVVTQWGPWSDIEEIYPEVKAAVDAAVGITGAFAEGPKNPARAEPRHVHGSSAQGPKSHEEF